MGIGERSATARVGLSTRRVRSPVHPPLSWPAVRPLAVTIAVRLPFTAAADCLDAPPITADDGGAAVRNRQRGGRALSRPPPSSHSGATATVTVPDRRALLFTALLLAMWRQCEDGALWARQIDNNWADRSAVSALSGLS
jgi:hypothetical protein